MALLQPGAGHHLMLRLMSTNDRSRYLSNALYSFSGKSFLKTESLTRYVVVFDMGSRDTCTYLLAAVLRACRRDAQGTLGDLRLQILYPANAAKQVLATQRREPALGRLHANHARVLARGNVDLFARKARSTVQIA